MRPRPGSPRPGPQELAGRRPGRRGPRGAGRGGARSPPGPGLGGRPRPTGVCSFGFSPSKLGINIFKRPFIQGSNPSAAFSAFCFSHLVPKSKQQSLGLVPPSTAPRPSPVRSPETGTSELGPPGPVSQIPEIQWESVSGSDWPGPRAPLNPRTGPVPPGSSGSQARPDSRGDVPGQRQLLGTPRLALSCSARRCAAAATGSVCRRGGRARPPPRASETQLGDTLGVTDPGRAEVTRP